jgi:drug/metabolite transporter (DMT)-like permease
MSITVVSSLAYMYFAKVPDAPFGNKQVRPLLLARGFGGFFGVFGLYYSLVYLPLAEATVITFLAPMVAAWACSVFMKTSFTKTQQIGFVISLLGVVLIAQPFHFTSASQAITGPSSNSTTSPETTSNSTETSDLPHVHEVTPSEHIFAVFVGLTGVCGAACAYTTISWIGKRAHPLISVNYFATWCTFVSAIALIAVPSVKFRLPSGVWEWTLMAFLGISGFVMQFLLTASLAHTGGGKGLNMVYTQMLFALGFDKIIWGVSPGVISIIGSSLILGSAIWVAMKKEEKKETVPAARTDEEEGLIRRVEIDEDDAV